MPVFKILYDQQLIWNFLEKYKNLALGDTPFEEEDLDDDSDEAIIDNDLGEEIFLKQLREREQAMALAAGITPKETVVTKEEASKPEEPKPEAGSSGNGRPIVIGLAVFSCACESLITSNQASG